MIVSFRSSLIDTCKNSVRGVPRGTFEELPEHEVKPLARSPADVGKKLNKECLRYALFSMGCISSTASRQER